jgi:N-acetyl sugar amidotransferase
MDSISDPDIKFDEQGVCNYVHEFYAGLENNCPQNADSILEETIQQIKANGKGKPYDCLTGISGGVDSSYLIYKAKEWGLRPLIVHFDNGWNTEIAVRNINNIIKKTGFDLYTIVVDWEEFRDLQLSYIKAGVVDLEVPTDHAIYATWYKLSKKFNIKYVLSGNNYITESIMPPSWIFNKADSLNIKTIHDQFGTIKLKTYPIFRSKEQFLYNHFLKIQQVKPLNLINYDKREAYKTLVEELDWVDYGGKHYESFYTKFYQAFILPQKFKIDKRKPHLTNLILAGQITREEALIELQKPLYEPSVLSEDKDYFLKKMGVSQEFFDKYLLAPSVPQSQYGVQPFLSDQYKWIKYLKPFYRLFSK